MTNLCGVACACYCFRDNRNNRVSLFDGIEEGGIRAQSVFSSSHEIDEHDNEQALDGLQDRVSLLKRVSLILVSVYPRPHLVVLSM